MKSILEKILIAIVIMFVFCGCKVVEKSSVKHQASEYRGYVITHLLRNDFYPFAFYNDYSVFCQDFPEVEEFMSDSSRLINFSESMKISTQINNSCFQIFSVESMKSYGYQLDTCFAMTYVANQGFPFINNIESRFGKQVSGLFYVQKVIFDGVRAKDVIHSGRFMNARVYDLNRILIFENKSLRVLSKYHMMVFD